MADAQKYAEWIVANQDKKGTPEFETVAQAYRQAKAAGQQKPAPKAPAEPYKPESFLAESAKRAVGGLVEPMVSLGTGAVAAPIAGLSGIAATLGNAAGLTDKDPGDVVRSVQSAMTYDPKTEGGKAAQWLIGALPEAISDAADAAGGKVTDWTNSPLLGTAVNTGIQAIPMLAGAKAVGTRNVGEVNPTSKVAAALTEQRNRASVRDQTLAEGMEQGLVAPPSAVSPTWYNKLIESIGGKAAMRQEAQRRNQPVVDKIISEDLGLRGDTALTKDKLEAYRHWAAEPYRRIADLSPDAKTALSELQKARFREREYTNSPNPADREIGRAAKADAELWEQIIEAEATKSGQPGLPESLRKARKFIAKSHDAQSALNPGDASISAPTLGRMLADGKPLSGGQETVAKFQQAMAPYMGEGANVTTPGVSNVKPAGAAALSGSPSGIIADVLMALGAPARSLALSPEYQRYFAQPKHGSLNRIPSDAEILIEALKRRRDQSAVGAAIAGEEQ